MDFLELQECYESLISQLARYESEIDALRAGQPAGIGSQVDDSEHLTRLRERVAELTAERDRIKAELTEASATLTETANLLTQERAEVARLKSLDRGVMELRIVAPNGKERSIKGVFHAQFKRLFQLASNRMNPFLYGPTGCGKTHICGQVAEALGLRFAFISCSAGMSEGQLLGRLLPVGKGGQFSYVASEFVECYENGGVFLLDELDAADPNVLLIVNAALANGHLALPNRPEKPVAKRHKDFVCVAAANTVGTGADRLYSGRNKLDAATLDRFQIGKVYLDYDPTVEEQLCPDTSLRTRLQGYRKAVRANGLERAVSSRFLRDAFVMKSQAEWTDAEIDAVLFQGWREDEVNKVKNYRS